jgi:hypothetical protein
MGIGAGDHEDAMALEPMVTGKDICRQQRSGEVADV